VFRALQKAWPETRFSWIIGTVEARLMSAVLPGVEFITFDKRATRAELLRIRTLLAQRRFDLLLHLQLSFRASLLSTCVRARVRLGFDRARARELQWLFTNAQITPRDREHVLDSLLGFVRACGIEPGPPQWNIEHSAAAHDYAATVIPDDQPTLLISPCSSHTARNWSVAGYAALARHAITTHRMRVVLVGGPSPVERSTGAAIESAAGLTLVNQIGKDTLPLLLALIARARALVSPDSGPAHMATMVGTPVIGLYAATNPARSGPYRSLATCIDRYEMASRRFLGKPAGEIPWSTKIERPGVMDLIEQSEVTAMLDTVMQTPNLGRIEP
jgi:heptosyltransferase I